MKRKKYIRMILIGVFVLLIFLPMMGVFRENVNKEHVAETENRQINQLPAFVPWTKDFYAGIEAWFTDRILGRKDLISKWAYWNGRIFNVITSKEIVKGEDDYLFWRFATETQNKDNEEKIEQLNKLNNICKSRNTRFIVLLAPPTEWIVSELLPKEYADNDYTLAVNMFHKSLKERDIEFVDVYSDLKNEPLSVRKEMYVKNDYHWTDFGAYKAARNFLNHLGIAKNINKQVSYRETETIVNSYTRRIGIEGNKMTVRTPWNDSFVTTNKLKLEHVVAYEERNVANEIEGQRGETIITNESADNRVKILVIGDSYWSSLGKYVMQDTYQVIFSHNIDIRDRKKSIDVEKMIDTYKPDIVLYEKAGLFFFGYNYSGVFGTWAVK